MATVDELKAFEADIAEEFNAGRIRAPIHLSGGNEDEVLRIFQHVRKGDWVLTQWRSHYHCLLKGVPPDQLRADILAGRSITLCYPEYRIVSSAIVGGILPIGIGIAASIKRHGGGEKVWCFIGDMTATTGAFIECIRYATGYDLPIEFIIEDNGKSVCTDTSRTWNGLTDDIEFEYRPVKNVTRYSYDLPWPHSGAGQRVEF